MTFGDATREAKERVSHRGRAFRALVARIALGMRQGDLLPDDARQAAEDLVGLWQGFLTVELGIGFRVRPSEESLRARAARGVQQFVRLHGREPLSSRE